MAGSSPGPGPWVTRVGWLVLPLVVGPVLSEALAPRLTAVRTTASILAWAGWAAALVAVFVPRTVSLTALRLAAPAAAVLAIWSAVVVPSDDVTAWLRVLAVVTAVATTAAVLSPLTADAFVDGSSYGPERRLTLRAPAAVLLGAGVAAWIVAVAGATAGPLLLAGERWGAGAVALVAGWPAAWVAGRALHGLARRWLVFVPAGVVLHDPLALGDPVLVPRRSLRRIGPAEEGTDALDLTLGSPGLALQLDLAEPLSVPRRTGRRRLEDVRASRLLFTPSRPAEVLREAGRRRLPVG